MVYSDEKRDKCPFCKGELTQDIENEGIFECHSCRTQIMSHVCPETGEAYFATAIKNHKDDLILSKDKVTARRQLLSAMHFRNITDIDEHQNAVCPRCGKVH